LTDLGLLGISLFSATTGVVLIVKSNIFIYRFSQYRLYQSCFTISIKTS